jgi:hypothetical protein
MAVKWQPNGVPTPLRISQVGSHRSVREYPAMAAAAARPICKGTEHLMTTNADTPRQDRDYRELHVVVLLLALVVGLLITGAAVYLASVHPSLAGPLGVGAAVLSALAGAVGVVTRAVRNCR